MLCACSWLFIWDTKFSGMASIFYETLKIELEDHNAFLLKVIGVPVTKNVFF